MTISSFDAVAEMAKAKGNKTVIAVVEATDVRTIESLIIAEKDAIVKPALIGNSEKIKALLYGCGAAPDDYIIVHSASVTESMCHAIDMVKSGEAEALMKGSIDTAEFMRAIVSKESDLLAESRLSLTGLFEIPNYHKILAISDIVVNTYPDLECKNAIIRNAVWMLNALGLALPKVAVLAAVEKVNPKMPETIDADALKQMYIKNEITGCIIDGPISFDLATSITAARMKRYESPVAGDADLLIVPDLVSGNVLAKALTGMAGALTAGVVLGAKVPIVLTSRSAEATDKYYSIALAACIGVRAYG